MSDIPDIIIAVSVPVIVCWMLWLIYKDNQRSGDS